MDTNDVSDKPRSREDFEEALTITKLSLISEGVIKLPPRLVLQLPTIIEALKKAIAGSTIRTQGVGSDDFKEDCFALRAQIEETKGQTMLVIHNHPALTSVDVQHQTVEPQRNEMIANLKLAYRHLEDARMRFGKAIQAFEGGISCNKR